MSKNPKKILNHLSKVLEKKNLKPSDNISELKLFDSIIIKKLMVYKYQNVKK